jgi:hypothetical protein
MYHDDDVILLLVCKILMFLPIQNFFKLNDGDRHERIVMDTVFATVTNYNTKAANVCHSSKLSAAIQEHVIAELLDHKEHNNKKAS